MNAESTDAVVLRRVNYGDADLILTLFTRDFGKVSALARSARRSKRRFGAAIGLFSVFVGEFKRRPNADLWTLTSAAGKKSYAGIAFDVAAMAHGSYVTELVRELTPAEQVDHDIFALLVEAYATIEKHGASPPLLRAFEIKLLTAVGLAPTLSSCVRCGTADDTRFEERTLFDPNQGGVVCAQCGSTSTGLGVRPLSAGARRSLIAAARTASLAEAAVLEPMAGDADGRDAMLAFLHHHIGKPLRSVEFINKMRASAAAHLSPLAADPGDA